MLWISKVIAPLALIAGVAAATTMARPDAEENQPPSGKGGFGKGAEKKGDDKKGEKWEKWGKKWEKKESAPAAPQKADPQVDAWLAILLTKITDPHDTVRDSARGAIVAVGSGALPALKKLADGDDSAKAVAARKMIAAIERHSGHGGMAIPDRAKGPRGRGGWGGPPWIGPGHGRGMGPGWHFGPRGGDAPKRGGGPPKRGGGEEEDNAEVAPPPHLVTNR
jgi:hypothetical protein